MLQGKSFRLFPNPAKWWTSYIPIIYVFFLLSLSLALSLSLSLALSLSLYIYIYYIYIYKYLHLQNGAKFLPFARKKRVSERASFFFCGRGVFEIFQIFQIYDFGTATLPDQTATLPDHTETCFTAVFFCKTSFSLQEQRTVTPFGATAEKSTTWKM